MEIKQLTTFKTVAHTLSFSKAAEELSYAQSTVTAQIQALEQELATPLFNRLGKRISLTEAGEHLLDYAERLTRMEEEARKVVSTADEEPAGLLTLAAAETIIAFHLPDVLRAYRQRYPAVQLSFYPADSAEVIKAAQSGEVDLALDYLGNFNAPQLDFEVFTNDTLRLLAAPDHPLAQQAALQPQDIESESLLLTDRFCSYRRLFEQQLLSFDVKPQSKMDFISTTALKQCIMAGLGLGWLPEKAVRAELDAGDLVILDWLGKDQPIAAIVAWHRDKWMSPAAHAFRQLLREMLPAQRSLEIEPG